MQEDVYFWILLYFFSSFTFTIDPRVHQIDFRCSQAYLLVYG
ncbi:hypothetical protein ACJIZ3_005517 [Penstemon smallii]|uniref:Uncharacterized protein n=1 Tax=Penstemon smallii TaxID=265156 RepID=A0ABD3S587_9LAMI